MLLVPITARANFWAMKFISLVDFEQEKKPIALAAVRVADGPEAVGGTLERFVPRWPAAARRRRGRGAA